MKPFSVYAILLGVVSAAAVSSRTGADMEAMAWAPLVWTGPVKVGGGNVTLSGTAKEIYNQIIAINPDYDSQLGVKNPREANDTVHVRRHGIDPDNPINLDSRICGIFQETNQDWAFEGIDYLYSIGNGGCSAPAGRGGCVRTACNSGAGIFLCNDHPEPITVPCKFVADNALGLNIHCVRDKYVPGPAGSGNIGLWFHYVRGQIFSFDGSWNVIISSSDCSRSAAGGP
ncbi:hypothetical protein GGI35DRAFT_449217 [Trichoderma velutinum]